MFVAAVEAAAAAACSSIFIAFTALIVRVQLPHFESSTILPGRRAR